MDRKLILVFVLLAGCCSAQIMQQVAGTVAVLGFPPITLGVHCSHDNASGSATTVVCGPMTPAAGSTIYCDVKFANGSTLPFITDNVNAATYQTAVVPLRDAGHNFIYGSMYEENVAASATTITLNYTTTATHGQIACKEIKGVPTSYALDSTVMQSQAATSTNPANPNSYTPFANGEMVLSGAEVASTTPTAGTNFTLLDGASTLFPEYWIQTTATATTAPFTDASSIGYAIGMAAFAPNTGGNCDSTMLFDWTGGSNTGTPTTTTLQSSTKGGQAQPNGDQLSNKPGWTLKSSAGGTTYATAAYVPLVTTRNCPFYSGSGAGTLGIDHNTTTAGGVTYHFETTRNKVTMGACMSTTEPASTGGNIDTIEIAGGDNSGSSDFVNFNWSSGGTSFWNLEPKGGASVASTGHWVTNTAYWIRLEYNKANDFVITSWAIDGSNNVTFTGTYASGVAQYVAGDTLVIQGLTHGSYMNTHVITVASSTATTFVGTFTHATDSSTEAGGAGHPHRIYIYTTSGSNCTGTPTLEETIVASGFVASGGYADDFGFFDGLSLGFASGHDFYVGATAGDILYGSSLMP